MKGSTNSASQQPQQGSWKANLEKLDVWNSK
jgi:hypothetical protein